MGEAGLTPARPVTHTAPPLDASHLVIFALILSRQAPAPAPSPRPPSLACCHPAAMPFPYPRAPNPSLPLSPAPLQLTKFLVKGMAYRKVGSAVLAARMASSPGACVWSSRQSMNSMVSSANG